MNFTTLTELEIPAAFDAHVHLRDGEMSELVTPTIRQGGVNQVYVMVRIGKTKHMSLIQFPKLLLLNLEKTCEESTYLIETLTPCPTFQCSFKSGLKKTCYSYIHI